MYVPLDVNFPDDPKIMDASLEAVAIYVMALCVAKRLPTDGVLTEGHLRRLGASTSVIVELETSDLVRPDVSGRPGHVQITAWLDHNASQAEVESKRQTDAQRKRVSRRKRPQDVQSDASTPSENVRPLEVEIEADIEVEVDAENPVIISGDHPVPAAVAEVLDHVADLMADAGMASGKITQRSSWRKVTRASLDSNAELLTKVRHGLATYDEPPKTIAQWSQVIRDARWMARRTEAAS